MINNKCLPNILEYLGLLNFIVRLKERDFGVFGWIVDRSYPTCACSWAEFITLWMSTVCYLMRWGRGLDTACSLDLPGCSW